jgi:hypothetical protein
MKISQKSAGPPARVPDEKLVRDIRRTTHKRHSADSKVRGVPEELDSEENIENIGKYGPETVAFTVPFPTPLPLTKTCSQPWLDLDIPEYLRAFRQKP